MIHGSSGGVEIYALMITHRACVTVPLLYRYGDIIIRMCSLPILSFKSVTKSVTPLLLLLVLVVIKPPTERSCSCDWLVVVVVAVNYYYLYPDGILCEELSRSWLCAVRGAVTVGSRGSSGGRGGRGDDLSCHKGLYLLGMSS